MEVLRVIIRHRETKQFCNSEAMWIEKEEEARGFSNVLDAFKFAAQHRLRDVQVMFRYKPEAELPPKKRVTTALYRTRQ